MRERGIVVWVLLGAVLLTVLNLPESVSGQAKAVLREGLAPLQHAVSGVGRTLRESMRSIRGISTLYTENQKMASELVRLRNEVRGLEALKEENLELREQLQFMQRSERELIPCEVIARDITGWWQTVRIGKGSGSGLAPSMAVLTSDGLVGKTLDVSLRTCDVLLISDPKCKVSARIARTGAFGVVVGTGPTSGGRPACRMQFVNKDIPVLPGDEVVTSGLGGVFPKGLLIGYVERVEMDAAGLYQSAYVIPKADLDMLTYVFVAAEQANPIDDYLRRMEFRGGGMP